MTPPAQLANWLSTPEGRDAVVSAAIGVGDVVFGATAIVLHGEYPEEVDRAALLVEAVFDHRVRLHSRLGEGSPRRRARHDPGGARRGPPLRSFPSAAPRRA